MKRMKKILVLLTMLFTGLSFKGANAADKMVVADAAAKGSYAYLKNAVDSVNWIAPWQLSDKGINGLSAIKTILITNDVNKVRKSGYVDGCPIDLGDTKHAPTNKTNGCAVAAYYYPTATDTTKFDCILYADVETIYASKGESLFDNFSEVEKITFDFINDGKFSMANAEDKSMKKMFFYDEKLKQIDGLEYLVTTNVTDMQSMFYYCNVSTLNVSSFDTSSVTTMSNMFGMNYSLTTIEGLEKWDTAKVTNMTNMFEFCELLKSLNVSGFDTSNVNSFNSMFSHCEELTTITGLDNFKTSNATDMSDMFSNCSKLQEIDVSSFDTSNVKNFSWMFGNCNSITTLDLSNFTIKEGANLYNFLSQYFSKQLIEIKLPKSIDSSCKIKLSSTFGVDEIDSSMAGMTIIRGTQKLNDLVSTLRALKTCDDYMQGPELQVVYDELNSTDKETFAKLTDNDGVILADKLAYMVYLADYHSNTDTAATHMAISPVTGQYLVIIIACLSLALIGGYYFIQKKRYAI